MISVELEDPGSWPATPLSPEDSPEPWREEQARELAKLDPLRADEALARLPGLNAGGDRAAVIHLLNRLCPGLETVSRFDSLQCNAALRDIGICLGSIRRWGIEPEQAVPRVTPVLIRLGARVDLPPRDNLLHYTIWNPRGARQRRYTGLPVELALVDAVRGCLEPLIHAVDELYQLRQFSLRAPEFAALADVAASHLKALLVSIVHAKKLVDPLDFARDLRPYFDPVLVDGRAHKGPGAVEMPLFMVDHLLWSANTADPGILEFQHSYLPDQFEFIRRRYHAVAGQGALLDMIEREVSEVTACDRARVLANMARIEGIFRLLIKFRGPHLAMARRAYEDPSISYQQGSGGFPPAVLNHVLDHTKSARRRLKALMMRLDPDAASRLGAPLLH